MHGMHKVRFKVRGSTFKVESVGSLAGVAKEAWAYGPLLWNTCTEREFLEPGADLRKSNWAGSQFGEGYSGPGRGDRSRDQPEQAASSRHCRASQHLNPARALRAAMR